MTFGRVFSTEVLKLRRCKVTWLTWLAFSIMPLAGGLFVWIAREPAAAERFGLLGQKALVAGTLGDAPSYFRLLLQSTGLGGMILVSVIAAFVFGREHADGTAKNVFTLPVARHWFVFAKLAVTLLWFFALTISLLVEGFAVAWFLGLPGLSIHLALSSSVDVMLAALVAWLLVPIVAWIATLGRGYLAPMGFTTFTLVLGNVLGATGWGKWFPWSVVPLFAGVAGPRTETLAPGSIIVLLFAFLAGVAATIAQVRYADNTQ